MLRNKETPSLAGVKRDEISSLDGAIFVLLGIVVICTSSFKDNGPQPGQPSLPP
jgi:hypothetical protein